MALVHVRARADSNRLYFDFSYRGIRCREQTKLADTKGNRRRAEALAKRMSAEMELGTFDYLTYFPGGKRAAAFFAPEQISQSAPANASLPVFEDYVETWWTSP